MQKLTLANCSEKQKTCENNLIEKWRYHMIHDFFSKNVVDKIKLNGELTSRYTFSTVKSEKFDHCLIVNELNQLMTTFGSKDDIDQKVRNRDWHIRGMLS